MPATTATTAVAASCGAPTARRACATGCASSASSAVASGHWSVGRAHAAETAQPPYVRWLLIALGVVVLFALLRFGGGVGLRAALPLVLLAGLVLVVRYYSRRL